MPDSADARATGDRPGRGVAALDCHQPTDEGLREGLLVINASRVQPSIVGDHELLVHGPIIVHPQRRLAAKEITLRRFEAAGCDTAGDDHDRKRVPADPRIRGEGRISPEDFEPKRQATHADLLTHLAERSEVVSAAGLQIEVRAFRAFFSWYAEQYECTNPAARLKTVRVPEAPVRAITAVEHRALLAQCSALTFLDRRDRAILAVLWSTGMRRSELARVEMDDLDLAGQIIQIPKTKTGKARMVGSMTPP